MKRRQRFGHSWPSVLVLCLTTLLACQGVPPETGESEAEIVPPTSTPLSDRDGDGVPDLTDNCPRAPNAPIAGVQPAICGATSGEALTQFVSLRSRAFAPAVGLHPTLRNGVGSGRRHFT